MPAGPVVVTLERRTLAAQATSTSPPAPAVTAVGLVDAPDGYLAVDRNGTARNMAKTARDIYVLTIAPAASPATPTP